MASVTLMNLEKVFDNGLLAVQNINLEIKDGEFMVLVGPSGCAKSTTLRMIAGLESISGGEILIDNEIVNELSPKDRCVSMVFQNYALYPHYNVKENMEFGLKISKIPLETINKLITRTSKVLELENVLYNKPKELSGGQRQRVALGRALVREPKVFLFDEPLSNLDAKLRLHMRVQITKLHHQLKKSGKSSTMIYVTHDQVEAMTMGDRICVMNYGKIMQVDTPLNLYNFPQNKFVASFIGSPSMNFIKAQILVENRAVFILINEEKVLLPKEKGEKLKNYDKNKIWLGIRPECIFLNSPNENYYKFKGSILMLEQTGHEFYIYFNSFNNKQLVARISESFNYNLGNDLYLYLDLDKVHIFDFITEINLCL